MKSLLSKWNHRRRWLSKSKRVSKRVGQDSKAPDAPSLAEVQALLAQFAPLDCSLPLRRIGPDNDGGYLVPDDLEGIEALFSPGVSETLGFDLEIAKLGIPAHLADASVSRPRDLAENMTFTKSFIGAEDAGLFLKMETWVNRHAPGASDLLLQMDIEGAEYDVLPVISDPLLQRFRIILLEIHDLHRVFERSSFDKIRATVERLNETHQICHVHANNTAPYYRLGDHLVPPVIELTYLRKDHLPKQQLQPAKYPHPLDQINEAKLPDPGTTKFWIP